LSQQQIQTITTKRGAHLFSLLLCLFRFQVGYRSTTTIGQGICIEYSGLLNIHQQADINSM